ncbi:MAG: peptidase T [Chloroflexia bacterium]|nr:peptidase T [Chloroflexia bacterium]
MTTLRDRFLRYVKIFTTSDPHSKSYPSTERQWDLLKLLQSELLSIGASDVEITAHGYVLATIPATPGYEQAPVVAFLAHVDTAPDFSGEGVKPIIHANYDGRVIVLPDDPRQVIDPSNPMYANILTAVGKDVITASGTTLLGADDKAGIAIIMTAAQQLLSDPSIPHGKIRICFNPDEEIGHGVDHLDIAHLGASAAYTFDGGAVGEVSWETFSADGAVVEITGVSTHPGTAHDYGMVNAVHLAGKLLGMLPREFAAPESTTGRVGFIHPTSIEGNTAAATVRFIIRDHDNEKLAAKGRALQLICEALQATYPTSNIRCTLSSSYRNMGYWLRDRPEIMAKLRAACADVGVVSYDQPVRGGTDGSRLTERGLPTPNVFTGGNNAHGPLEWVAVQDMQRGVDVMIALAKRWAM